MPKGGARPGAGRKKNDIPTRILSAAIPMPLYEAVAARARAEECSVNRMTIKLLEEALQQHNQTDQEETPQP